MIGIPSGIGQAKQVCSILNELCKEDEMSAEEALRTAVILPDEHLLIPVLNAIPEQIKRINVTMGYPLAGTPVASLMEIYSGFAKEYSLCGPEAGVLFPGCLANPEPSVYLDYFSGDGF